MTTKTIDPYFEWLCRKVHIMHNKLRYFELARYLHECPFKPSVYIGTDNNRAYDGLQLRVDFMEKHGALGSAMNRGPCTMLEFLIGIAKRMGFLMENDENPHLTAKYFWILMGNLGLSKISDEQYEYKNGDFYIQDAIDRILYRTYEPSGAGGLFPLQKSYEDQRKTEIWYQMQQWLAENSGDLSL